MLAVRAAPKAALSVIGIVLLMLLRVISRPLLFLTTLTFAGGLLATIVFVSQHHYVDASRAAVIMAVAAVFHFGVTQLLAFGYMVHR